MPVSTSLVASDESAEADTLVVRCEPDDRELLLEDAPDTYYLTDYYAKYPLVLVRMSELTEDALRAGAVTPQIRALLEFECARARDYYARASRALPSVDARSLVAAEIMGGIYFEILHRIERAGYDVFRERIRVPRPYRALIALRLWMKSLLGWR